MANKSQLPKVCIALGFADTATLLQHAHAEVDSGESFLEFRLDYLANPIDGVAAIKKFLADHPDCTVMASTLDGIVCLSACVIRGNTCWFNGNNSDGAGVHATGGGNRIEGNTCTSADRGIGVDAAGNIIIRNTCSGNTLDWDIVANNIYGPIIDRRVPASAAVSGFTAASTLGSTEPNANFSY